MTDDPIGTGDDTHLSGGQSSLIPSRVGRYHIKRVIDAGGMGTVYEATQEHPRRTVAVKVMNPGMTTPSALRRFETESQILGRLQHANVAQIYEAGTHDDPAGPVPFFAMEYIANARSITEYAQAHDLTIEQRLELFAQVCDAVGHGHAKGIFHRDLKPANVLVNADGQPKLIDFGVARATDADLVVTTLQTSMGQLIGTLQYMSPEQIDADPHNIDARSDVYAMGVVLYELLTGRLPYELDHLSLSEVARVIKEKQPTRIESIDAELRGSIAGIVLCAMQKDRDRRYRDAGALGEDIRRYLRGEPIEPLRASMVYVIRTRLRRSARRYPAAAMLVTVIVAAVIVRLIGVPFVYEWTPLGSMTELAVTSLVTPPGQGVLERVRVIQVNDETDIDAVAARERLDGVSTGNVRSLRRLYGRLMEKLADSGVQAVVFDITFRTETEFDADFVKGVQSLRSNNIPVVIATRRYVFDDQGAPEISPVILPHVSWGSLAGKFNATAPWRVNALCLRDGVDPVPGLALAAFAAGKHPEAYIDLVLDQSTHEIVIEYQADVPGDTGRRRNVAAPDRVPVSTVATYAASDAHKDETDVGLRQGDRVAHRIVNLPTNQVLSDVETEIETVLSASREQQQAWFNNRIAIVGVTRGGSDLHTHPDGRVTTGLIAHAASIDNLLRTSAIRTMTISEFWIFLIIACVAGATIGTLCRRLRHVIAIVAAATVMLGIVSVTLYYFQSFLAIPWPGIIGVALTAALTRLLPR